MNLQIYIYIYILLQYISHQSNSSSIELINMNSSIYIIRLIHIISYRIVIILIIEIS